MIISIPIDCDNAPKRRFIKDFILMFFQNEWKKIELTLDDKFEFDVVGKNKIIDRVTLEKYLLTNSGISKLTVNEILSHGKFAACNGYLITDVNKIDFAYFFEFKSAGKNKISKIYEYKILSEKTASL